MDDAPVDAFMRSTADGDPDLFPQPKRKREPTRRFLATAAWTILILGFPVAWLLRYYGLSRRMGIDLLAILITFTVTVAAVVVRSAGNRTKPPLPSALTAAALMAAGVSLSAALARFSVWFIIADHPARGPLG